MGQRLNIEVWNNGKALANAYYHWSGYTDSAAKLVDVVLKYIDNNPSHEENVMLYAIRILEATGAALTFDQVAYAKKLPELEDATFAECKSRNYGLIGIAKEAMNETRLWQEGSVYIFLDEKRISFRVFFTQRRFDWEKEQREDYGNENANAKDLDVVSLNFDDIKFDEWDDFNDFLCSREEPFICELERWEVVTPIY